MTTETTLSQCGPEGLHHWNCPQQLKFSQCQSCDTHVNQAWDFCLLPMIQEVNLLFSACLSFSRPETSQVTAHSCTTKGHKGTTHVLDSLTT